MRQLLVILILFGAPFLAFAQDEVSASDQSTFEIGEGTRFFRQFFKKAEPACCLNSKGVKQCEKKSGEKYGKVRCRDNSISKVCRCTINASGNINASLKPTPKPTKKPTPRPTSKPRPTARPTSQPSCCKHCSSGQPCGDSCISQSFTCRKGDGCAC